LTNRLTRYTHRDPALKSDLAATSPDRAAHLHAELAALSRRAQLIGRAITLCTVTALLVCTVIATLFVAAFASFDASVPVALFFVAAMVAFFAGLVFFLGEICIATANLRIGPH